MRYDQLVVIHNCEFNITEQETFNKIFKAHEFHKPKIVGVVETVSGRKDFFFFINNKDINKFSIWRLRYGMRWFEDIYYNNEQDEYPEHILKMYPKRW